MINRVRILTKVGTKAILIGSAVIFIDFPAWSQPPTSGQTSDASDASSCLGPDASSNDQLKRAEASASYTTCFASLAKQQNATCASIPASAGPLQSMQCSRRAQAFQDMALATQAFHQADDTCKISPTAMNCQMANDAKRRLEQVAIGLTGS